MSEKTKEVTFIHTIEMTSICKVGDDEKIRDAKEIMRGMEKFLGRYLHVFDDIKVTKVQIFERDLTNED